MPVNLAPACVCEGILRVECNGAREVAECVIILFENPVDFSPFPKHPVLRVEFDRACEVGNGLVVTLQNTVDLTTAAIGVCIVWLQLDGSGEIHECVLA